MYQKEKQEGGRGQPEEKKAKAIPAIVLACNKFLMNFNVSTLLNLFSGVQSQQDLARRIGQGHGNHQHELWSHVKGSPTLICMV